MKSQLRYLAILIVIIVAATITYWAVNKRSIVSKSVSKVVAEKSDSLYYLRYDSSVIDELNGNVSFFNVVLQSDSVQKRIAEGDTSENIIYRVRVGEITVKGANIPGLLKGNKIKARAILLINPDVVLTRMGNKVNQPFSQKDSIALYEKILGKFKSIQADEISVKGGTLGFSNKNEASHTTLKNIDVSLKNFRIDSTKDYTNLVSYFVKGVIAKVEEIIMKEPGKAELNFNNVEYNAAKRVVRIGKFRQKNVSGRIISDIDNIAIDGLETNIFINDQKLIADELSTGGGMISIYKKTNAKKETNIELDSSFFDKASLNKIMIGKTKVLIYDRDEPLTPPLIINNTTFNASDIPPITSGNTLKNIISNSNWKVGGDGLSTVSKNKLYKLIFGPFIIDKGKSEIKVQKISMVPQLTENEFIRTRKVQEDLFELQFNNIVSSGVDIKKLIEERTLTAEKISVQPLIKIFRDLTMQPDTTSKMGKYPHQVLKDLKLPLNIRRINLQNGKVSYRERGAISEQVGQIFFDRLSASVTNVTNNRDIINKSPNMILQAAAKFMGVSNFTTKWILPLNSNNGSFSLEGKLGPIEGAILNSALEPQGMASVRKGKVNSYDFRTTGNDISAKTTSTLLYQGLKLEVLKKKGDDNELKKKSTLSFFANIIIRDENPHNGNTRKNEGEYKRDITKSFFNLVWKSQFTTLKKTITGKSNAN